MGFLSLLGKGRTEMMTLPNGAFTVDALGRIIISTVPGSVPEKRIKAIAEQVLAVFNGAHSAQFHFSELVVQYGAFTITAREIRGGALIYLAPKDARRRF